MMPTRLHLRSLCACFYVLCSVAALSICKAEERASDHGERSACPRVAVSVSAGISRSGVERGVDVSKAEYSRTGFAADVRVLVKPGYHLAIGAEFGTVGISSLLVKEDSVLPAGSTMNLAALPIMAVFAMEWSDLELSAGPGVVLYRFNGTVGTETTQSSDWETAWSVGLTYFLPINPSLRLGIGVREIVIPERRVNSTSALLHLEWSR
ncbi:MAG: hypothetical protein ACKOBV_06165 [Candidatus Kapaibacterium sp.]